MLHHHLILQQAVVKTSERLQFFHTKQRILDNSILALKQKTVKILRKHAFIGKDVNLSFQKKKALISSKVLLSIIFMSTITLLSSVSILSFSIMLELGKVSFIFS